MWPKLEAALGNIGVACGHVQVVPKMPNQEAQIYYRNAHIAKKLSSVGAKNRSLGGESNQEIRMAPGWVLLSLGLIL